MNDQQVLALEPVPSRAAVGRARRTDPVTSHQAAAGDHRGIARLVYLALRAHPNGLTDWEILGCCGLPERKRGSVVKRRGDLGAVDTGLRRLSPDGRECVVWVLPARVTLR